MKDILYTNKRFSIGLDDMFKYVWQCNFCGTDYNEIIRNTFKNKTIHYAVICKCCTNQKKRHLGFLPTHFSKSFKSIDGITSREFKRIKKNKVSTKIKK